MIIIAPVKIIAYFDKNVESNIYNYPYGILSCYIRFFKQPFLIIYILKINSMDITRYKRHF